MIIAVTLWGGALAAQEAVTMAECDKLNPNKGSDLRKAMGCVELYKGKLEDIETRLTALEALQTPAVGDHEKTRAVVAYVADKGQASCPKGWELYEPAKDRFILGAGGTLAKVQEEGGQTVVSLTLENMPKHRHVVTSSPPDENIHDGFGGSAHDFGLSPIYNPSITPETGWSQTQHPEFMSEVGGDTPINTIPPFVALFFCTKK
ncbi:hypothetical protein J7443_21135 [Tropicibacter sp. R15_0]|uniref:hypothetical protein n=1 Tax=Tropicibacter sp. R15_0 TaxID=2821101 RepID=UPI001ADB9D81|nr:hypothetical protein [Tropicibacter sp. R15_0]MBO9467749.1 hypothetical protein [Tropicibacter sp. R15_0]